MVVLGARCDAPRPVVLWSCATCYCRGSSVVYVGDSWLSSWDEQTECRVSNASLGGYSDVSGRSSSRRRL
ncbi:hypothetical protein RSAG8_02799, partial [Rhizoctonia solani AG-8 WAC10335]